MNIPACLLGFILGVAYGWAAGGRYHPAVLAAGLLMAVLLANYPYYDPPWISTTYAAAFAGVVVGGWWR